jgi:cell division protein FtsQ
MSGEFIYTGYTGAPPLENGRISGDPRLEPSREEAEFKAGEERKAGGLTGIKALIIAAGAVLVLEMLWLFVISPCMPLSRLEVASFSGLDRGEVLRRAGIGERSSYISVKPRIVEKNLEAVREVESVRVIKRFPNSVSILVVPRTAVAVAFERIGGRQTPVYFDRRGILFKTGGSLSPAQSPYAAHLGLPVISGLPMEEPLPAVYLPLFASLDQIRYADPQLLLTISEIRINRKPYGGFDLVLYPVHSPVRVRVESKLTEETLRYVMLMLNVFAERNQEIEEIDFRTETASYKLKEASSG